MLNKLEIVINSRNKESITSSVIELILLNVTVSEIKLNISNIPADELLNIKKMLVTLANKPLIMIGQVEEKISEITKETEPIEDE